MRIPVLAVLAAAALSTSCAPTADSAAEGSAPSGGRQCFSVAQVDNFRQGRPDQVFLRVGRNDVYELNAAGGCQDLNFANRLAIIPDGGSVGTRLCTDDWARVVVPGSVAEATVCRVRIDRKLTAEEVAAIPAAHRP